MCVHSVYICVFVACYVYACVCGVVCICVCLGVVTVYVCVLCICDIYHIYIRGGVYAYSMVCRVYCLCVCEHCGLVCVYMCGVCESQKARRCQRTITAFVLTAALFEAASSIHFCVHQTSYPAISPASRYSPDSASPFSVGLLRLQAHAIFSL